MIILIKTIDLKAFERRLMEIVSLQRPATRRWRVILCVSSLLTSASAFYWLNDPKTAHISLLDSLMSHYLFTINCIVLIALFAMGIHKRVVATSMYAIPNIILILFIARTKLYQFLIKFLIYSIISRTRQVLADFAMSCDDNGRLILKPRQLKNCIEQLKQIWRLVPLSPRFTILLETCDQNNFNFSLNLLLFF